VLFRENVTDATSSGSTRSIGAPSNVFWRLPMRYSCPSCQKMIWWSTGRHRH
jgi:hypothetical protein